jgi:hypothetical protein
MSALDQIITEYGRQAREHPNAIGEILRAWAFPGDGYGCYSTFELRPEFAPVTPTPREFAVLWMRPYDPRDTAPSTMGYCDAEAITEIQWFKHPNGIEVGWYWDGDGTLAFVSDELADEHYTGAVVNGDCKKDNEWRFQERR